ncbi:dihydroorotase, partial [Gemmiger formicilis]|uniref:dihydroorotase n=1 Tax=Gemmiger formicilis TaxID=745368 RepID=UPI00242ED356
YYQTRLHMCHVSTRGAIEAIQMAKLRGAPVTCEVTPHHLWFTNDTCDYRVNPPIRTADDVQALIDAIRSGVVDAIATDHAPHSAEEKARPLTRAPSGMVGLETSLAVTLTALYHTGKMELTEIVRRMTVNPASILGLSKGRLALGNDADIVIFDPNEEWTVDPEQFASK